MYHIFTIDNYPLYSLGIYFCLSVNACQFVLPPAIDAEFDSSASDVAQARQSV